MYVHVQLYLYLPITCTACSHVSFLSEGGYQTKNGGTIIFGKNLSALPKMQEFPTSVGGFDAIATNCLNTSSQLTKEVFSFIHYKRMCLQTFVYIICIYVLHVHVHVLASNLYIHVYIMYMYLWMCE